MLTDDGDYHPISSPGAFGAGELKIWIVASSWVVTHVQINMASTSDKTS